MLNRSRDPRDHVGFLTLWVGEAHRAQRFPKWERDELLSEAYIQADRLLTSVYDPERSTVVTFLKRFLPGAVHYRYWTSNGFRFTPTGPRLKLHVTSDTLCEVVAPSPPPSSFQLPDLSEEEWIIVRLRLDGYTMSRIASVLGLRSPQSIYNRIVKIKDKFHGESHTDAG